MIRASYGIVWAIASIGGQPGDAFIPSMTGGGMSGPAVRKYATASPRWPAATSSSRCDT